MTEDLSRTYAAGRQTDVDVIVSEVPSGAHADRLRAHELDLTIGVNGMPDARLATRVLYDFRVDCAILAAWWRFLLPSTLT